MIRIVAAVAIFCAGLFIAAQAQDTCIGCGVTGMFKPSGGTGWCGLVPVQGSLVNCWPFDTAHSSSATVQDVTGGKNATMSNFSLVGSGPSTNLNNAGSFNGTSSIGTTTLANLPTSAFTLNIWLNPNSGGGGGNRPLANCHPASNSEGFELLAGGSGNQATLYIGNGTLNVQAVTGGSLTAGSWSMVTFAYNGATLTPYLNASAGTPGALTGPLVNCSTDVAFGYDPAYSGDYYNGYIAGVAFWNTALTGAQITTLHGL